MWSIAIRRLVGEKAPNPTLLCSVTLSKLFHPSTQFQLLTRVAARTEDLDSGQMIFLNTLNLFQQLILLEFTQAGHALNKVHTKRSLRDCSIPNGFSVSHRSPVSDHQWSSLSCLQHSCSVREVSAMLLFPEWSFLTSG